MNYRKRVLAGALSAALLVSSLTPFSVHGETTAMTIGSLEVNALEQPLGIDDSKPVFSWQLSAPGQWDRGQSAYRLIVSSTAEKAGAHEGDVWDSGKCEGDKNYNIVYGGEDLQSRTKYYWAVNVWDEDGKDQGWSSVSDFETGIFTDEEWRGEWIGVKNNDMTFDGANWIWQTGTDGVGTITSAPGGVPQGTQYFRRTFTVDQTKTVSNVYVGVTADDEYVCYVNGTEVGQNGGEDSWKNGKLYDITAQIDRTGENVVAIPVVNTSPGYAGLLAKVVICYGDDTKEEIVTDTTWKTASEETEGWKTTEFDDSSWKAPDQCVKYGDSPWGKGVQPNAEDAFAATVLRTEFDAGDKKIERARAYVCGLGFFELKVNGELPDDTVLNPANTQYTQTVLYRAFDVTDLVKAGKNAIGVELGNSFYNETCSVWNWQDAKWRDAPKLKMELVVEYADGTKKEVATDTENWKATKNGPITTNSIYYGETYDARKELTGYAAAGYNDTAWGNAQEMEAPTGELKAQVMEPIRRTATMKPKEIKKLDNGSYIVSTPEMLAGWIRLNIKNPQAGQKVTITYGEKLKEDGTVEKLGGKDGVNAGWWPMAYNQQDNYICKGGSGAEVFEPKFSYKGYQYVQIDGYEGELTEADVDCYRISNDMPITGTFTSSNELLNRMHRMMMTTMNNNMQGKPTDTPVWEKNGWLGDANVALETMLYNYGFENMLTQFVETMEDCLDEFNNVPNMVPTQGWGNDNSVVWNSIFIFAVEGMLDAYGKEDYVAEQYEAMRKLALKDIKESQRHGWTWSDGQLADWVSPMGQGDENAGLKYNESPNEGSGIVGTAFAYHLLDVIAQLADRLGKTEDAAEYRSAMEKMYKAFNEKFFNEEKQIYETTTWSNNGPNRSRYRQTSQLVPLAFGLVPEEKREIVLANLVKDIKEKNYHLDTGCVGSKFILPILSENGYEEIAYRVASQNTYPSWGFMLEQGSTSLWEMWETTSRSLGHYFLGTYDQWFYEGLAGIKDMKEGYRTVTIEPAVCGDENETASASVETVRGSISSGWKRAGNTVTYDVSIPVGTTATIRLAADGEQISCNGKKLSEKPEGVRNYEAVGNKLQIEVGSGTYTFAADLVKDQADKTELRLVIAQAESYRQLDYEKEAWQAFLPVLEQAIAVRDNVQATEEEVAAAKTSLEEAMATLAEHINQERADLKKYLAGLDAINEKEFPWAQVKNYRTAYEKAMAARDDVEATAEDLQKAKADMEEAKSSLAASAFMNLALNKPTEVSSTHNDGNWDWHQDNITDGERKHVNSSGEYAGYHSGTGNGSKNHEEWIKIDLGKDETVNMVTLYPSTASPKTPNSCENFAVDFTIDLSTVTVYW